MSSVRAFCLIVVSLILVMVDPSVSVADMESRRDDVAYIFTYKICSNTPSLIERMENAWDLGPQIVIPGLWWQSFSEAMLAFQFWTPASGLKALLQSKGYGEALEACYPNDKSQQDLFTQELRRIDSSAKISGAFATAFTFVAGGALMGVIRKASPWLGRVLDVSFWGVVGYTVYDAIKNYFDQMKASKSVFQRVNAIVDAQGRQADPEVLGRALNADLQDAGKSMNAGLVQMLESKLAERKRRWAASTDPSEKSNLEQVIEKIEILLSDARRTY